MPVASAIMSSDAPENQRAHSAFKGDIRIIGAGPSTLITAWRWAVDDGEDAAVKYASASTRRAKAVGTV
jgi:ribulose 1,5-bisphosphate synthetase/thiazole synthase